MKIAARLPAIMLLATILGGCAAGAVNTATPRIGTGIDNSTRARPSPPPRREFSARGLEAIIGKRDEELVALFGPPRLDIIEGSARKLQFTGSACVLDIYLYPSQSGQERISNYAEARNTKGADVDSASCVAALRRN